MRVVKPCGTNAAYVRHIKAGEKPCDPCRIAHNTYARSWTSTAPAAARKKAKDARKSTARWAAFRRLAKRYPDEFEELYRKELAERGLDQ